MKKPKLTLEEKKIATLGKKQVSIVTVIQLIRSLASMLKASIPLSEAMAILEDQTDEKSFKEMLKEIKKDIDSGAKLSYSMAKFPKTFPEIIVSLVYSGELGGSLETNLAYLADYLAKQHEVKKKIKGALVYPIIIIGLTSLELIGMIFFVFPKLESLFKTFPNVPQTTVTMMLVAGYIRTHWYFFLAGILLFAFLFKKFLSTKVGQRLLDWVSINMPILKALFIANILSNFSRTLGLLLQSGIHITKSLKIAINTVDNSIYSDKISQIYLNAKKGQSISESLSEHPKFFNRTYVKMIEVGEKTGTLEDNLQYLYTYYTDRVSEITNNITTFMEPLLLIFVGAIIGLLGLSVIVPIYQLMGSINA